MIYKRLAGMSEAEQIRSEYVDRIAQAKERVDQKMGDWQQARMDYQEAQVDPERLLGNAA